MEKYPFDGPGRILAHAFFPGEFGSYEGDIHFDNDEDWKLNPGELEDGIDFFTVAVHELGHSLGLGHSASPDSIMNPYYKRQQTRSFSLGYDDILGLYHLYITRKREYSSITNDSEEEESTSTTMKTVSTTDIQTTITTPASRITSTTVSTQIDIMFIGDDETVEEHKSHDDKHGIPDPVEPLTPLPPVLTNDSTDPCTGHYDAVAYLREDLFIFKNGWVWRLSNQGHVLEPYPVRIHRLFNKLPQSIKIIDAGYQRERDSSIILFIGNKYWVSNGNDFTEGSPRPITDYGLPNYLRKIDAAMIWDKNKKTYLFSGDKYWRYNETTRRMDNDYPKSIAMFRGIPPNLDAAMTWRDGITYFFKDQLYWAFNNTWKKTEAQYPKSSSHYWLGCK